MTFGEGAARLHQHERGPHAEGGPEQLPVLCFQIPGFGLNLEAYC